MLRKLVKKYHSCIIMRTFNLFIFIFILWLAVVFTLSKSIYGHKHFNNKIPNFTFTIFYTALEMLTIIQYNIVQFIYIFHLLF